MKKLYLSRTDKKLTGLCGGVGQMFGIDPTIVRLLLVAVALFSFGSAFLIYIAASFIVPKEPGDAFNGGNPYSFNEFYQNR
ncbi:PspC domain-containing protein [Paenibacillus oenotherae]|uniref:PspC domain-containing protein n=1 Tax=Paenibacillus oenotherae TaxID=1435645 RepID=A0ABS7D7Y9_9BACL|nr:PspC domain-containing protein [Paenibacillus oenotherae]MBW7476059.1 PspC domain-containing protein [Paenibacillus oenotherae]